MQNTPPGRPWSCWPSIAPRASRPVRQIGCSGPLKRWAIPARRTAKGGVLVDLGGRRRGPAAGGSRRHAGRHGGGGEEQRPPAPDALGRDASANNGEAENVRGLYPWRAGAAREPCSCATPPSTSTASTATPSAPSTAAEVVLDEDVKSAEETRALGIEVGDVVCFEPRTRRHRLRLYQEPLSGRQAVGGHPAGLWPSTLRTPAQSPSAMCTSM